MDSSMCLSAPDLEMWIIQGTLAWRTPPVRTGLSLEHRFRFGLNGKNGAPNNASSQTKNYEITPFILG
ncbi:hypothetical protein V2J09_022289 [Rumex salicifolius]